MLVRFKRAQTKQRLLANTNSAKEEVSTPLNSCQHPKRVSIASVDPFSEEDNQVMVNWTQDGSPLAAPPLLLRSAASLCHFMIHEATHSHEWSANSSSPADAQSVITTETASSSIGENDDSDTMSAVSSVCGGRSLQGDAQRFQSIVSVSTTLSPLTEEHEDNDNDESSDTSDTKDLSNAKTSDSKSLTTLQEKFPWPLLPSTESVTQPQAMSLMNWISPRKTSETSSKETKVDNEDSAKNVEAANILLVLKHASAITESFPRLKSKRVAANKRKRANSVFSEMGGDTEDVENCSQNTNSAGTRKTKRPRQNTAKASAGKKRSTAKPKAIQPKETATLSPPGSHVSPQGGFSLSLATPDDPKELNSLHCFVRSELLELFCLEGTVNSSPSKSKNSALSVPNQRIGIRCVHCGRLPREERMTAADSSKKGSVSSGPCPMSTFFPKSLDDIYRSVCTWQRIHFKACPHIPQEMVTKYQYLKDTDRSRGKKSHWANSARQLGLRNADSNRSGIVWKPDEEA